MLPCKDHGQKGNADGYGHSGKLKLHRKVFLKTYGYLPDVVMHECDNPRCIEPTHLKPGDWDSNNKDRASKKRSAVNVVARRKLTQVQAEEIRSRYSPVRCRVNGVSALAREFGVDANVIYNIVKRRTHNGESTTEREC